MLVGMLVILVEALGLALVYEGDEVHHPLDSTLLPLGARRAHRAGWGRGRRGCLLLIYLTTLCQIVKVVLSMESDIELKNQCQKCVSKYKDFNFLHFT